MAEFTANFTLEQIEAIESSFMLNESTQLDAIFMVHPTPSKTSELVNDSGFIDEEVDPIYTADKPNIALKSEIPTTLVELDDDSTHRLVTDIQINDWDNKQDALGFVPYTKTEVNNIFEYKLPSTPANPETKFLNANKEWSDISIGNGGYSANLYFTSDDSDIPTYKKISYELPVAETELTATIPTGEYLLRTYLIDETISVSTIDSGLWVANFTSKVSVNNQDIKLKCELFLRHSNGTETALFSAYSPILINETYSVIRTESNQPSFNCASTDRLGIRIYGYTTSVSDVTIDTIIGDGRASYFSTPLRLKHSQLRNLNSDNNYLHITDTEKNNYNTAYTNTHTHSNKTILDNTTSSFTTEQASNLANQSGINTGDQDLSAYATIIQVEQAKLFAIAMAVAL